MGEMRCAFLFLFSISSFAFSDSSVQVLGEVISLSPKKDYVLIRSFPQKKMPKEGVLVRARSFLKEKQSRASLLRVTGEKQGDIWIADVVKGEIDRGMIILSSPFF